jgi:3-hydroxymyristoyl/3-hydroxydecanoyl-(acyl carrier protein) dehydratase
VIAAGAFRVAADHPCLPGHFPGRPIVPGVVLLDEALALVLVQAPGLRVAELPSVRFLRPVRPGEAVAVEHEPAAPGRVGFVGRVAGEDALRGTALLETNGGTALLETNGGTALLAQATDPT